MTSIADLLLERGRIEADYRRRAGERRGALVSSLGQIPIGILDDRRAERAAQAKAAEAAARQRLADERAERELALKEAAGQREASKLRADEDTVARGQMEAERGRAALEAWIGTHEATIGPERAAQMRAIMQTPDGVKHLVEHLSKAPEQFRLIERDPTKDMVNPMTGEVVTRGTPKEEKEPSPTEAILAMKAAAGDRQAQAALDKLRALRAPHPEARQDPLANQTEWAIAPGETEARLMTKDEIRRLGAKRPAGADKPSSGQQKRVLNFFNRAQQADTDLEQLEGDIAKMGIVGQVQMNRAWNPLKTEQQQLYTQAQRAFTEARLRKDSGAAIPPQEFENDRKTYFVQPGDSEATIKQKRRARGAMLASLGFESGQALGEFLGDADEAKRVIEGYKSRASGTETKAKPPADPLGIR